MDAYPLNRRTFLALPAILAARGAFAQQPKKTQPKPSDSPPETSPADIPVQGQAGAGLERLDQVVREHLARSAIPGAALAVARGGALVVARGYGWANVEAHEPVQPRTLFGVASVSKSLTAVAILKLVEAGRLKLDDPAFERIDAIRPLPGDEVDPRLRTITVRQLLHHAGGWDRKLSGDPNGFSQRVSERMGVKPPITPEQLIRFMLGQRLDFDPGTASRYSNFGYVVLGEILARVSGQPYEEAVRSLVLHPLGLDRIRLDVPRGKGYVPGEAHRYGSRGRADAGGGHLLITMASGGWLASAVDLVRFLTALDGTRGGRFLPPALLKEMTAPPPPPYKPRPEGVSFGLGWDQVKRTPQGAFYCKGGGMVGVHSHIEHMPDATDWALLWNGGRRGESSDDGTPQQFVKELRQALAAIEAWPHDDLFRDASFRTP
jgi:N-acyl-D-amino-acid deacylase